MKKAVAIGAMALALSLAVLLILPAFVDLGRFKGTYLPLVEDTLHRNVDVDKVSLRLIPAPSIRLSNLKISDSPTFPQNTFFNARQVILRLELWALLRGRFEVTEFVLDQPVINLVKQPDGTFNYSDIAGTKIPAHKRRDLRRSPSPAKPQEPSPIPLVVPRRLSIKNGQLNLEGNGQKPVRISGIDLSLEEFSNGQPFPYRASFNFPGLKTISVEGRLDYREERATIELKESRLKVHDLVLPVQGTVSSLSTAPRVNLVLANDQVDASPIFNILSVFGLAPHDTEASGPMGLRLTLAGPSHGLVTQVEGRFQDVRIHGKRALKGSLSGDMSLRLPLGSASAVAQRLRGEGKLTARDGELTNVDLIKKIQRVTGLMGFSPDERREVTSFKNLAAEFTIGNGLVDFTRIYLVNPQLEFTGSGTMTLERPELNLNLEARLSAQASTRAGRGRASNLFKDSQGRVVVPLKITGPVENPSVNLDSKKMTQSGMTRSLEKSLGSFFKQMFRR